MSVGCELNNSFPKITDLSFNVLEIIFDKAVRSSKTPEEEDATLRSLSCTCSIFRKTLEFNILPEYWNRIKHAERTVQKDEYITPYTVDYFNLQDSVKRAEDVANYHLYLNDKKSEVYTRFHCLNQELRKQGAQINRLSSRAKDIHKPGFLGFLPSPYSQTQEAVDRALKGFWQALAVAPDLTSNELDPFGSPIRTRSPTILSKMRLDHEDSKSWSTRKIRSWLNNSHSQSNLSAITVLVVSFLNSASLKGSPKAPLNLLPGEICQFSNLTELYVNDCNLSHLPQTIGFLTKLEYLDVSNNSLSSLPDGICNLKNLKELKLQNNCLVNRGISPEIFALPKVNMFNVSNNALRTIPEPISLWKSKTLNMRENPVVYLPDSVSELNREGAIEISLDVALISFLIAKEIDPNLMACFRKEDNKRRKYSASEVLFSYLKNVQESCSQYHCQSKLAYFCQEIHKGTDSEVLFRLKRDLPQHFKQKIADNTQEISSAEWKSAGNRVKEKREMWIYAIAKAIGLEFASLSKEQKQDVYAEIWRISQSISLSEPLDASNQESSSSNVTLLKAANSIENVAKEIAISNPILFVDALSLIAFGKEIK